MKHSEWKSILFESGRISAIAALVLFALSAFDPSAASAQIFDPPNDEQEVYFDGELIDETFAEDFAIHTLIDWRACIDPNMFVSVGIGFENLKLDDCIVLLEEYTGPGSIDHQYMLTWVTNEECGTYDDSDACYGNYEWAFQIGFTPQSVGSFSPYAMEYVVDADILGVMAQTSCQLVEINPELAQYIWTSPAEVYQIAALRFYGEAMVGNVSCDVEYREQYADYCVWLQDDAPSSLWDGNDLDCDDAWNQDMYWIGSRCSSCPEIVEHLGDGVDHPFEEIEAEIEDNDSLIAGLSLVLLNCPANNPQPDSYDLWTQDMASELIWGMDLVGEFLADHIGDAYWSYAGSECFANLPHRTFP